MHGWRTNDGLFNLSNSAATSFSSIVSTIADSHWSSLMASTIAATANGGSMSLTVYFGDEGCPSEITALVYAQHVNKSTLNHQADASPSCNSSSIALP